MGGARRAGSEAVMARTVWRQDETGLGDGAGLAHRLSPRRTCGTQPAAGSQPAVSTCWPPGHADRKPPTTTGGWEAGGRSLPPTHVFLRTWALCSSAEPSQLRYPRRNFQASRLRLGLRPWGRAGGRLRGGPAARRPGPAPPHRKPRASLLRRSGLSAQGPAACGLRGPRGGPTPPP